MNRYKRFAAEFLGIELFLIAVVNIVLYTRLRTTKPMIERMQGEKIYKIIYTQTDYHTWILMDISLGIMFLLSVFFICFIGNKVLKPFDRMMFLTQELAKGNLSTPIPEEKSRFFGKFLWGMDMLRDALETSREKELALQKEKKTLILSLTHDIRTPLSAIGLYVRALAQGLYSSAEKQREIFDGIENNVSEIEGYLNEITVASREDFLNLFVNQTEVYLAYVIETVRSYYTEKFGRLYTEFEIDPYTDCILKGDADRLVEVFQNLLENALKYGDGQRITIAFSEEEDCRLVTVKNTGCTLKRDELNNLFDSFYRGSNVGTANGSGLGLYICKQLMHKMDGDVFASICDDEFCATVVVRKV